jgi:hypothetical protein
VERGQVFLTLEPGDSAATYLPAAMGETAKRICGMATDYGHWDASFEGCVGRFTAHPQIDREYASRLLSSNAQVFYGERLQRRLRSPFTAHVDYAMGAHA